ncbi:MAG: sigma-70 family RNA polymerase sigma factor [Planctomycetes bacterium]|nr:sigma-70 family RNA polymerase sigma factor [Planctomycetota bacterium]
MPGTKSASVEAEGPSDAELLHAARRGDACAFAALYGRHAPLVHALALGSVDRHAAEDVVQEVFVQAWRKLGELREAERFRAWIAAIARHRARSVRRSDERRGRRLAREIAVDGLAAGRGAEHGLARLEQEELLAELRALPEAYRETIALRYVEGLSTEEIAAVTELTPGSVRVNLCRGLKLLRERWSGEVPR